MCGGGGLLCDPGSELRLGRDQEKRRAKIIDGMRRKKREEQKNDKRKKTFEGGMKYVNDHCQNASAVVPSSLCL